MRLRRVLSSMVVAATASVLAVAFVPTASADVTPPPTYYLALGDSLSVGYQPLPVAGDTNRGYADDLFNNTLSPKYPTLQLVKDGCSGETTGTMINGGKCSQYPDAAHSQLATAEQFLRTHPGQVKYLTLDIGANDVDGCATGGSIDPVCVTKGIVTIAQNLQTILNGLTAADHKLPLSIGMNYYDPFLAEWLSTSPTGKAVAVASVSLLEAVNNTEGLLYLAHGFKVADVATAFHSLDFINQRTVAPYGKLPQNVAYICTYTYMCSVQNIHANDAGYQLIAATFAKKTG